MGKFERSCLGSFVCEDNDGKLEFVHLGLLEISLPQRQVNRELSDYFRIYNVMFDRKFSQCDIVFDTKLLEYPITIAVDGFRT